MEIKKEIEMNEKELIKHLVNHESTTIYFSGISYDGAWLSIEPEIESKVQFEFKDTSTSGKTFTVEVEETVTEDTKLDLLLDHFINPYGQHYVGNIHHNRSINDILEENDELEIATNFIHILDKETKEFKLIWIDGKLVE